MGARLRAHDWAQTPLGDPAGWPASLRTLIGLLLTSKFPMFLAWGPELTFIYNDGYVPIFGKKHPEGLGQPFARVWSEIWQEVGPLAERALAGEAVYRADLPLTMMRKGFEEETFFTFSYSPARDDEGRIAGVFCACTETTGEVKARQALIAEKEHLRDLFRQAPGFMCVLEGPELRFELVNDAYLQLVGYRDLTGKTVRDALPELQGQGFFELLDRVFDTGEVFVGRQMPLRLQRAPGSPAERVFVNFVYQPIFNGEGSVTGIFVEGSDVSDRARAQAHQQLLIHELNHRVKNTLATVQAIATQSFRAGEDPHEARALFTSRLLALSEAHNILNRENWDGAELREVVLGALGPFQAFGSARISVEGPSVRLSAKAALAIALAVHELATNAAKYGALSNADGRVRVHWGRHDGSAEPAQLRMDWREMGGPAVTPPSRRGFGSRLLERGLAAELDGKVKLTFPNSGVVCTLEAPLEEPARASYHAI